MSHHMLRGRGPPLLSGTFGGGGREVHCGCARNERQGSGTRGRGGREVHRGRAENERQGSDAKEKIEGWRLHLGS